jgi:hypothetical protein
MAEVPESGAELERVLRRAPESDGLWLITLPLFLGARLGSKKASNSPRGGGLAGSLGP